MFWYSEQSYFYLNSVLGHSGMKDNEKTDALAKIGTKIWVHGTRTIPGYCKEHCQRNYFKMNEGFNTHVLKRFPRTYSKNFITNSYTNASVQIREYSQKDLRIFTRQMTEHCRLGYYMRRLVLQQTSDSRLYSVEDKLAEHILGTCSKREVTKFKLFELTRQKPTDFRYHSIQP